MSNIRDRLGLENKNNSIRNRLGINVSNENNSSMKLFKKSNAFDDGYQFGDVTKTVASTVGDLATNIGKGFLNTVEGVTDAGQYLLADAAKGLSKVKALDIWDKNAREWLKEKANALEENAKFDSTGALFGNNEKESDNLFKKGWSEKLDKNSVSDGMLDSVAQGIGNVAAMAGTAYIGGQALGTGSTATSFLNSFSSAFGNAKSEAYKNGADDKTALETATVSGFAEAISEQFFDALPGMKVEGWGSKLTGKIGNSVSKHFGSKTGKLTLKALDSAGEGAEEVISNALTAIGNDIVHFVDGDYNYGMESQTGNVFKDTKNAFFSQDSLTSFISASLTSAIINGGNTFINEKQKKDIIKAYANEHNMSVDEATKMFNNYVNSNVNGKLDENVNFKDRVDLEEEEAKKLLASIKDGNIHLKNYTSNIDTIISQINEYETLKKQNRLTKSQEAELNNLKEQLNSINNEVSNTNVATDNSNNTKNINLPTVEDIVGQEKTSNNNTNLPVNNQLNNEISTNINSNKAILPITSNFNSSNINMPTSDIKVDMTKINPDILEDIKGFKLGDPNIESYKGSYIKTMLNEVGIKVPTAFNYVTEVRPDMGFTTSKGLTRNQNIAIGKALQQLKSVDITSINNTNQALMPVDLSQIRQVKGNIPINQELLNKYNNVDEIFLNEKNNYDGIVNIEPINIDIKGKNATEIYHIATEIFRNSHNKNIFVNDGNQIKVTNQDIKESINKIFNDRMQNNYLKEHLSVFGDLGDIIEKSHLVNQTIENKNRSKYNTWNYYFNGLNINNELFDLEFDVVSRADGENHYRLQRLKKANTQSTLPVNGEVDFGVSASSGNNITQSNENVKLPLPNTSNMQNDGDNSKNNSNKVLNPNEISQLTKEDANTTPILPTRASVNKVNDGNSHFAKNIKDKVNMLNADQKAEILSKKEVRYYDKVTNKESLEKAFNQLNDGGSAEILRWIKQDSKNATATDVAEGWILLKQYSDNGDYDSMVEVAKKMREIGTTAGQTVQAFNIMARMTPEGMVKYAQSELSEAYERMVKNKSKEWIDKHREDFALKPDEVKFIMDTMQEISKMVDGYDKKVKLAEIQKLMTDKLPSEKGAGIRAWMRISMLFNPKTQVRNVAGNALIMPINSFGDLFSSYADKLISKKTGVRTTGNINIKAMLKGIKKGAYEATNDYKKGINTKDMEGNRFEISDGKSFNDKKLIGKALNRTESLLNYVMDVGDRVFGEAAFENSLQNQMVLNNTTEITQEMIDIAHQEALSRTWNDNNNYTRFVLGVRKGLNKLNINGYGLGDVLIPFAKTPANLTKAIVDYSPAGLVGTITKGVNLKRALTNGQYTASMQHEFVQSLGKATAGTMLYVLGLALAKAGITSGDSDDDKDTANFLKNTLGINSYSIKIGGKSFTYDWAQPLAAPLSITANIVNSKDSDSKALLEGIVGSLDSAGSILLEQSFLQSINDVLSDNDGVVSGIINEVLQLPARAVPTFSKQIADLVDGTQRTSFEYGKPLKTATNSIKAKIPFLSKTLNPSVDTMGREIQKYGGKNNIFNVFLNPANVSTENISESAEEIYRLYKETGETNVMPRVAPYYINQNGEKVMMTGEDRVKYQKTSGEIIEDNVKKLLKNNDYQQLNNTEKAEIINKIVNYSYNKAREEVLGIEMSNEYNKINSYVDDGGNAADYYLNKKEIDYSYSNPGKYKTITQITSYNDYLSYKENIDTIKEKCTNSSQRKAAVIKYVNSLDLTIPQKAMLIKMNYSSYDSYDNQIINYVNNQNITISEKTAILEELGFKVRNGKVYSK